VVAGLVAGRMGVVSGPIPFKLMPTKKLHKEARLI